MTLNKDLYMQLTSQYLFFKNGLENFDKYCNDSNFRKNLGSIVFGTHKPFIGAPVDIVDQAVKEGFLNKGKAFVKQTKENLEDIVNDVTTKTKDDQIMQLALALGPYATNPKYKEAKKLHKEIVEGQNALKSGNIDYMAETLSRIYRDFAGTVEYFYLSPVRENLRHIYEGILGMKIREFTKHFSTKAKRKDKKGKEVEVDVVDRTKVSDYIVDSAKHIKVKDRLEKYGILGNLYLEYNKHKP